MPKDDYNECMKKSILRLDCLAERAKNFAKLVDMRVNESLACPINSALSRRVNNDMLALVSSR